ncbi:hypothetical protein DM01DRAFT_1340940 [Hesseltinella vesiculosa]|uniref:Uncharacterized protein n=1 Tax=Hesseltinella vesiculosa TaxID=101127 RepID=A0A1X2G2I5_9FUNG|nr:hypothetical protein DM01DRAFT_1340940 [Hesseltinella vesiculosa]
MKLQMTPLLLVLGMSVAIPTLAILQLAFAVISDWFFEFPWNTRRLSHTLLNLMVQ